VSRYGETATAAPGWRPPPTRTWAWTRRRSARRS